MKSKDKNDPIDQQENAGSAALAADMDPETIQMVTEYRQLRNAFDASDPESTKKAAEQGNYVAMIVCGGYCFEKQSYAEAAEWFRKAIDSPNKAISVSARIRYGCAVFAQGGDENFEESREIIRDIMLGSFFDDWNFMKYFGSYQKQASKFYSDHMVFKEGTLLPYEVSGIAQAAKKDDVMAELLNALDAKNENEHRLYEKKEKQENVRKTILVRSGHAGILLVRLAEIAAMFALVPLAQQIFKLGAGTDNLLIAAHFAVLGFLVFSIPGLMFYIMVRTAPGEIGYLIWGVILAVACAYGIFHLERWSVVRMHYHTYMITVIVLGACLIVFFLCSAVRHFVGICTGK